MILVSSNFEWVSEMASQENPTTEKNKDTTTTITKETATNVRKISSLKKIKNSQSPSIIIDSLEDKLFPT